MIRLNLYSLCMPMNKALMVVSKSLILFGCFLLFCQYGESQEHSLESSDYEHCSLCDQDEHEQLMDLEQEHEEVNRLKLKFGFKRYSMKKNKMFQIPLLLEFQSPVTSSGNFKWLLQSGIVQTETYTSKGILEKIIAPEFFSDFDFKDDDDDDEYPLFLIDRSHQVLFQTGFQYEFGVLQTNLMGGVILGGSYTTYWIGNVVLGVDLVSDVLNMEIGLEKLYRKDHSYWGASISFGFYIKEWT